MIKVIPPESWKFNEPQLQMIKVASSGLRGNDLKALIKRASHSFADAVRSLDLKPGDIPVHVIALGATEFYGPNRNGDGFKEATCREHHGSFVKHARWYRNHQNKNPEKSYGLVKHSEFNDAMKRIELLIVLNGTKEAADRNGGFIADEEVKKLHEGKDIPVSMACKVAYDVCAGCGNRAKNRNEYCTGEDEGGMCKRGGVKNRMTMVHEDGFINYVENPNPLYFDMSNVFRGADRIAWTNGIVKAASGLLIGGAELAETLGVEMPPHLAASQLKRWPTPLEKIAIRLAEYELELDNEKQASYGDWGFSVVEPRTWKDHGSTRQQALAALAMYKVAMPIEGFAALVLDKEASEYTAMAKRHLPGIYQSMLTQVFSQVDYGTSEYMPFGAVTYPLMKWAADRAEDYSLDKIYVEKRTKRAAVRGADMPIYTQRSLTKVAGDALHLANEYAKYKLAFLAAVQKTDTDFELTSRLAIRQNYFQ